MSENRQTSPLQKLLSLRVRPLALLCTLFVIVSLGVMLIDRVQQNTAELQSYVITLRNERDQLIREQNKLKNEVAILNTDDYIIAKARQLYGYMMKDELLFVIKNPEALYGTDETIEMYVIEELP